MKAIKYVLAGALLLGTAAPTMAQDLTVQSATEMVKSKTADVKQLTKAFKKDVSALTQIGQAYLVINDTLNASKFANAAINVKSNDNVAKAKAYMLLGDIAVRKDDGGEASMWYSQAKLANPKEVDAYYRYAFVNSKNPEDAVKNLEEMRQYVASDSVDAMAGRIYYKRDRYEEAVTYYDKVGNKSTMNDEDLGYYAYSLWLLGKKEQSIEVCKTGLNKTPGRALLNRIAFFSYTDLKQGDNALEYADRFFNKSENARPNDLDYIYYGTALIQKDRFDDAIQAFDKALSLNPDDKKQAQSINKHLKDLYLKKGDYDKAVEYLNKSFEGGETVNDLYDVADLYIEIASKQSEAGNAADAKTYFLKASDTYGRIAAKSDVSDKVKAYCINRQAGINATLDPDSEQGLAKPYYEQLADLLAGKAEKSAQDTDMLKNAYLYLMVYAINVKKDLPTSKSYASKLNEVDPGNEFASQVLAM